MTEMPTTQIPWLSPPVIAIIRARRSVGLIEAAESLYQAGLRAVEISLTTPGALEAITHIRKRTAEDQVIGVGTVLDGPTVDRAAEAGAQFVVSPICSAEIVNACRAAGLISVMGAYTPTEAFQAQQLGADLVKVFPANDLGPGYMRALLAPLPQLRLVPTGGVTVQRCREYLEAGCVAVGIGRAVVRDDWIEQGAFEEIRRRARAYVEAAADVRR